VVTVAPSRRSVSGSSGTFGRRCSGRTLLPEVLKGLPEELVFRKSFGTPLPEVRFFKKYCFFKKK